MHDDTSAWVGVIFSCGLLGSGHNKTSLALCLKDSEIATTCDEARLEKMQGDRSLATSDGLVLLSVSQP